MRVSIEESWEECEHEGCSGVETTIIKVYENERELAKVQRSSCFGISMEALIAELLEKICKEKIDKL